MDHKIYSFNFKDAMSSMKELKKVFKLLYYQSKLRFVIIAFLYMISGIIPVLSLVSTEFLLNSIQINVGTSVYYVVFPLGVYLLINFFSQGFYLLKNYIETMFKIDFAFNVNMIILKKIASLELKQMENSKIYDMIRRAQNDSSGRIYSVFSISLGFTSQIIGLIGSVALLIVWRKWVFLLIVIIPILSTIFSLRLGYEQYKIEYMRSSEKRKSGYYSFLLSNDIAFKEIKLYKTGEFFLNKYKNLSKKFIKQDKKIIKKRNAISLFLEILDQIISGFILFFIVMDAYAGKILLGSTVTYIRSVANIKSYISGILGSITAIYENTLYIKQIFDFMDLKTIDYETDNGINIDSINSIELKNVSFKYPNRTDYAIENISFKIVKNETVAFVGENGSGKTTLVKLICGLYKEFEGQILINDISIDKINEKSLFKLFSTVFQDFNKYEMTCKENIVMGNIDEIENHEKLHSMTKEAYISNLINELPNGIDTQLGVWFDDGIQLSGGQWQKIAISRAFFSNASCFIFDEPSSALDPISEYEVFEKSKSLAQNKIGIFISHRLYNIEKIADKVLVFKNGYLVEEGTHKELINKNGYYEYLYNLQNDLTEIVSD